MAVYAGLHIGIYRDGNNRFNKAQEQFDAAHQGRGA
jgi:hypothetical protein